jgi:hypothetical protein
MPHAEEVGALNVHNHDKNSAGEWDQSLMDYKRHCW